MPELAFFRHGEELLRVALGDQTTIGRSADCDVSLPDPGLSRVQAVVERRAAGYPLVDRSGRGTRVGGADVTEAVLTDGTELAFGRLARPLPRVGLGGPRSHPGGGLTGIRPVEPAVAAQARLRVRDRGRERIVPLPDDGLTVGKVPGNGLVLDDPFVSARHLRIEPRDGRWQIVDLGSTNGTLLGGVAGGARRAPARRCPSPWATASSCSSSGRRRRGGSPGSFEGMFSPRPGHAAGLRPGRAGGRLRRRRHHPRRDRHRQGAGGPRPPRPLPPARRPVHPGELLGHRRDAHRERALRPREGGLLRRRAAAQGGLRGGRPAAPSSSTRSASCRSTSRPSCCARWSSGEVKRVGASRPITVSVRIVSATHRDLRGPGAGRQVPRGPLLPALRDPAGRCRRCARARATSGRWPSASSTPRRRAACSCAGARRPCAGWRPTTGPATCASCATWCSGRCSSAARARCSRPRR